MISLFRKEVSGFLNSLIAYMVISVFLTGIGLLMWVFPQTSILEYGYADMQTLFGLGPYVFMFLIPAITMRLFAEESKSGTLELLYTRPLTDMQIILGKYFSAVFIILFALLPTVIYYLTVYWLGNPQGNLDSAGIMGSYIGLVLLGAFFAALGLGASTLTENQIVAFLLAAFLCFLSYDGIDSIAGMDFWGAWGYRIEKLGAAYHYQSLSRGLVDSRAIIYFISMSAGILLWAKFIIGSRKW